METDIIIGIAVLFTSVSLLISLVVWARRIINKLSNEQFSTGRQALKELNG